MKSTFFRALATLMIAAWVMPAAASTDYSCLNACVNGGGKSANDCMSQCTHEDPTGHNPGVQSHTDYRCIELCKGGGKSSSACLSQCTYNSPADTKANALPNTTNGASLAKHEILEAPVPAGDAYIAPHDAAAKTTSAKNFNCINQCLHDGMQYQLCDQNCAAVTPGFN